MAKQNSKNAFSDQSLAITIAISTALITTLFSVAGGVGSHQSVEHQKVEAPAIPETEKAPPEEAPLQDAKVTDIDQVNEADQTAEATTKQLETASTKPVAPVAEIEEIAPRPGANRVAENMRLELPELSFEARFPAGSSDEKAYAETMTKIGKYRERLKQEATDSKVETEKNGVPFNAWDIDILYSELQRSGNIVSAMGREYSYTGGAHPNLNWEGIIAELDSGEHIELYDLFNPRKGFSPALTIAACEEIKSAKIARIGEAVIDGDAIDCASPATKDLIFQAEAALTSSTDINRFGGIMLMFAPYDLGPYVEGPYTITIDQVVFFQDLRPEYQALFGGKAKRPLTD